MALCLLSGCVSLEATRNIFGLTGKGDEMSTYVWSREIEGILCPTCHASLEFDKNSFFSSARDSLLVMMSCPVCGRDNYRVTITKTSKNNFARKSTRHEGVRADYEDAYSYLRFHTRLHHFQVSSFVMERKLGISFKVALMASESYDNSFLIDPLEIPRAPLLSPDELDDLPF
jgi:hypothetical protein